MERTIGQSFLGDYHSSHMKKRKPERSSDPAYFPTCKTLYISRIQFLIMMSASFVCFFTPRHLPFFKAISSGVSASLYVCVCVLF